MERNDIIVRNYKFFYSILFFSLFVIGCRQTSGKSVVFNLEEVPEGSGHKVGIRGNMLPLDWSKSLLLTKEGGDYSITINFPDSVENIEFKFVYYAEENNPTWEYSPNRTLKLSGENGKLTSINIWNKEQIIDVGSLKKLSKDKLLQDFELIKTMVLKVHPGTYRYNGKTEIDEALDDLKNKFSNSLSHQEAYLAISKLTAKINCDHTKVGFNNQNKTINSIIHLQKDKIPFTFRWIDDEMVILNNASGSESLARGTKVISINQVPVVDIRNKMLPYIAADGATDHNRIYKTEVNGYDFRYNAFDIFYPLLYPIVNQEIELELQQINKSSVESIFVHWMSRDERFRVLSDRYTEFPEKRDDMWDFKIISDNVAMLKINSFGLNGWKAMTIDYKAYLAQAFKRIDELDIQHLIIDIRENTGGNDEMSNELFTYLSEEAYNFDREGRTRYQEFPLSLKSYIQTWGDNPWYYNLSPKENKTEEGYYIFKDNFTQTMTKSDKQIFQGKLYLLTSAANTSLAFYTANRFKLQELGTIIGQETGGNLNDINGGQILFLRLPGSTIEIDFPVMGGFSTQSQPNTGVIPDIMISYSQQDIFNNRDLEVEEVLKLINE